MTTVFLSPIGNDAPFMRNGVPASGCKVFFYVSGSTTKQNTYTDSTGGTPNANPVLLNSEGYPASGGSVVGIWFTQGASYKVVLAPSTDTDPPTSAIWTRDGITGINDVTLSQSEWVGGPTPTYVSATQFTLVGDQTSNFHVGRRVKYTVTAGTGYATITASAFGAVTTVTVDSQGSNPLDSGLSAVSYSLLRADNFTQSLGLDAITRYATAIAAAATLNLNAVGGDHVHISSATSTSTITAVTLAQGHDRIVTFDSPQVLTSNASFILSTGTITASRGDSVRLRGEPSNVVRSVNYERFNGTPVSTQPTLGTPVATTSGTSVDITGIPSGVKRIVIPFVGVSTNGTSDLMIQIGKSGGPETSGYLSAAWRTGDSVTTSTAGFIVSAVTDAAADTFHGTITLILENSSNNTWTSAGALYKSSGVASRLNCSAGSKSLAGTLDRIRLTTTGGADTFDAGEINILYD